MHQGQLSGPPNPNDHSYNSQQNAQQQVRLNGGPPGGGQAGPSALGPNPLPALPAILSPNASSLDDLVSGAAKDADKAAGVVPAKNEAPKGKEPQEEKRSKKDKDKNMKLVYSDNDVSPEEKMAKMPRYAFTPSG